jgi:hypothetical protein
VNIRILYVIAVVVGMPALLLPAPGNIAYAHEFSSDESSEFLALMESIRVELALVQSNLPANVTFAIEHAAHAHEHLDEHTIEEIAERNQRLATDLPAALEELHMTVGNSSQSDVGAQIEEIENLLAETISVRVVRDQMTNATTQAVLIASIVEDALEHYKLAYGIGTDNEGDGHGDHESEMSMANMTEPAQNGTMVDVVSYQSAGGLADRALSLFAGTTKALAPANSTDAVAKVEDGLGLLSRSIAGMAPPGDIEVIVHGTIHPNLQQAYNLQIIPEFPLPVIVGIIAVAGMIGALRIAGLRRIRPL